MRSAPSENRLGAKGADARRELPILLPGARVAHVEVVGLGAVRARGLALLLIEQLHHPPAVLMPDLEQRADGSPSQEGGEVVAVATAALAGLVAPLRGLDLSAAVVHQLHARRRLGPLRHRLAEELVRVGGRQGAHLVERHPLLEQLVVLVLVEQVVKAHLKRRGRGWRGGWRRGVRQGARCMERRSSSRKAGRGQAGVRGGKWEG